DALLRLTCLPWFRYGTIPNWMRASLVNKLTQPEDAKVREALHAYLAGAERRTGDLTLARAERGRIAPVRDYVMLSFLLGRKIDRKQAVKPPSNWMWLIYRGGRFVFGPRVMFH